LTCGFDDVLFLEVDLREDRLGQGIRQAESDEIRGGFLFPVQEAASVADFDFAEAGAGRPRDSRRDAGATVARALVRIN